MQSIFTEHHNREAGCPHPSYPSFSFYTIIDFPTFTWENSHIFQNKDYIFQIPLQLGVATWLNSGQWNGRDFWVESFKGRACLFLPLHIYCSWSVHARLKLHLRPWERRPHSRDSREERQKLMGPTFPYYLSTAYILTPMGEVSKRLVCQSLFYLESLLHASKP